MRRRPGMIQSICAVIDGVIVYDTTPVPEINTPHNSQTESYVIHYIIITVGYCAVIVHVRGYVYASPGVC
jgi:hypothetical protein